jgi:hypothetical protein
MSNQPVIINRSGGVGFFGMLTLLFIGLKLTGNIAWSWLWVLSPIWIPMAIVLAVVVFMMILSIFAILLD